MPPKAAWYGEVSTTELVVRRLLLRLRVPPAVLEAVGRLSPAGKKERVRAAVARYRHWHGMRREATDDEWRSLTRGVPVLLYHRFGSEEMRFVVSPRVFARQMRLLSLLRFRVVPYGELAGAIAARRLPPSRTVVLTIDEGYADCVDAAKVVARHGFGATVFVVTGRAENDWSGSEHLRGRRLLSLDELPALREEGIELGSHTRSHLSLPELDDSALAEEVAGSRADLEQALGEHVGLFAYPYGSVDDRVVAAVRAAGFESACTVVRRPAQVDDDPLLVPRILIERSDSLLRFLLKAGSGWAFAV